MTTLIEKIDEIRARLLASATAGEKGLQPAYAMGVELDESNRDAIDNLMASHTVYTRTGY